MTAEIMPSGMPMTDMPTMASSDSISVVGNLARISSKTGSRLR